MTPLVVLLVALYTVHKVGLFKLLTLSLAAILAGVGLGLYLYQTHRLTRQSKLLK